MSWAPPIAPSELDPVAVKKYLAWSGAFWASETDPLTDLSDATKLPLDHKICVEAIRHAAYMGSEAIYGPACAFHHGGRMPANDSQSQQVGDGIAGPAFYEMMTSQRCGHADWDPKPEFKFADSGYLDDHQIELAMISLDPDQATAGGNWAGCNGYPDHHACLVDVDVRGMGSHLRQVFPTVIKSVREANRDAGLLYLFRDASTGIDLVTGKKLEGRANSFWSFVAHSSGWIGLATVQTRLPCGNSGSWARFLATYRGANVLSEWPTLMSHEGCHTSGYGHLSDRRSKQNPFIVEGLPIPWRGNDPLWPWWERTYTGEPVPVDDEPPPPAGESFIMQGSATLILPSGASKRMRTLALDY